MKLTEQCIQIGNQALGVTPCLKPLHEIVKRPMLRMFAHEFAYFVAHATWPLWGGAIRDLNYPRARTVFSRRSDIVDWVMAQWCTDCVWIDYNSMGSANQLVSWSEQLKCNKYEPWTSLPKVIYVDP